MEADALLIFWQKKILKSIKIKTNNRVLHAEITTDLFVKLNMGKPLFDWDKIPLSKKLNHSDVKIEVEWKNICKWFLSEYRKSSYNLFCQRL